MLDIDFAQIFIAFIVLLFSLTVHECAHAWTADRLGDPTARLLGRVSLNPIVHADPIGTVLFPIVAMVANAPLIGWAKPVPVNVHRLRHHRRDYVLVAAAGPASNIAQAVVAALAFRLLVGSGGDVGLAGSVLIGVVRINLLLAFFNLIPIPPLDGGNVLAGMLPPAAAGAFEALRRYGFILLYALMITGVVSALILPPMLLLGRILLP